jgi:uncharacterized SAM-binding protein YcdF (DUF218 family)
LISEREQFLARVLAPLPGDAPAIVVLCGEDGEERLKYGAALLKQGWGKTLVLSGGVDSESQQSAKTLYPKALGMGIAHDRIVVENESRNTREQSVNVVALAVKEEWSRLMLVGSAYHVPRAFLTFLKELQNVGKDEEIRLIPRVADHLPWDKCPKGQTRTRHQLFVGEMGKIALYSEHVASFAEGIDHLQLWESA